jgi:3',5'-cyclic-AMP phosphodiesterase
MILHPHDQGVVFVIPGDLHLVEAGQENHRVACRVIDEVNRLIRPDFVQFIGDNVQHATTEQFLLFRELASTLLVPHFALVGDHDDEGGESPARFRQYVGDPYGSIALRGFRFIRLNSREFRPVGFSEEQLDWLDEELVGAREADQQVVIFQHHYPYKVYEQFAGPGIDRWRRTMDAHRPVAILCGHTHYGQTANDGRYVSIAARSIGDPEGGPPGYLLGFVERDDLAIKQCSIADRATLALITHPRDALLATGPRHIVQAADRIRARTWSVEPLLGVRWRLDETIWRELHLDSRDHWSGALPSEGLEKGEHLVEVAAVGQAGEIVARDGVTFLFDPTGRYTPIPMVRPVVKQTAFC